ncbi:V-type proton ATPase catalytic subunit A-like [Telopea speciosissima]|uniref:V-type proton ATPase catalytic subunit A-like n=1 Tax=Telopea speciosissima TaxID=54955 RepID=UPI001CC5A67D|nr:V-type proton ATPase catalytic subunit A-like [Telopea speciosissima]
MGKVPLLVFVAFDGQNIFEVSFLFEFFGIHLIYNSHMVQDDKTYTTDECIEVQVFFSSCIKPEVDGGRYDDWESHLEQEGDVDYDSVGVDLVEEMPADSGYLAAHLASFYERAGKVKCLGSPECTGSVTIVGAVSPPGGDFSDPVTSVTLSIVQFHWIVWHSHISFPAFQALESFYEQFDSDFIGIRTKAREVLQREDDLNEIVQLVGKDALAETDKITLETAKLLREDYLAQNPFTRYDKFCPFYKSVWMMRNIIHFSNLANQAVERGAGMDGQKITYSLIKHKVGDLFYRLVSQKFEDPAEGEAALVAKFSKVHEDLTAGFRNLEDETR